MKNCDRLIDDIPLSSRWTGRLICTKLTFSKVILSRLRKLKGETCGQAGNIKKINGLGEGHQKPVSVPF